MLKTPRAKRMMEEILPLARYIQSTYSAGLRLKVRWRGGNQRYDALLHCSGGCVDHAGFPKQLYVEITTACHAKDYLVREELATKGGSFGPGQIVRDRKTREIKSEPYVRDYGDRESELVGQVRERIAEKTAQRRTAKRRYPSPTALLIQCWPSGLVLEDEWNKAVAELRKLKRPPFKEVVMIHGGKDWISTVFPNRPSARNHRR